MDDVQNGGGSAAVIVSRPPSSDTCGMIVNHGGNDDDGGRASAAAAAAAAAAQTTASTPVAAAAVVVAAALGVAPPTACPAPPYGVHLNNNNNNPVYKGQQPKGPGNTDHRTRRPRRGKRKRSKNIIPYMKDRMLRYKAVAPNNTNQFLMDDHNDGPDIDKRISARYNNENGRTRNSSYTSVESDGEPMYSSSDEDGSMIQKEFIATYRLVQEEELAVLTKNELTQRVIELEEKIQGLESKRYRQNNMTPLNGTSKEDEDNSIDPDEYRLMQMQIRELTTQNKILQTEIENLKQVQSRTNDSESSVDSESSSDSSDSTSSSSDGQEIEMNILVRSREPTDDNHTPKDD